MKENWEDISGDEEAGSVSDLIRERERERERERGWLRRHVVLLELYTAWLKSYACILM